MTKLAEFDREEFQVCDFCGKRILRMGFRGILVDQLKRHQETRECLKARVTRLESKVAVRC